MNRVDKQTEKALMKIASLAKKSAKAWEVTNDGHRSENVREKAAALHLGYAALAEQGAYENGWTLTWPGLYPTYKNNQGAEFYSADSAIIHGG